MTAESACAAVVAPDRPLVSELIESIGTDVLRIDPELLEAAPAGQEWRGERIVWIHIVPAFPRAQSALGEADLLLRSVQTARRTAAQARLSLTFLALVPSRGLFTGALGLSCDLARGTLEGLINNQIGAWSADGDRLLGVVYAGLEGQSLDGQRPDEDVRQRTPMGALGSVGQLADAVRFLCSAHASYVTGTLVHVDGGWNAYSWIYPARTI